MSPAQQPGLAVIGAGGHAKVVVSVLLAAGERVGALFDDDPSKWELELLGSPIRGPVADALKSGYRRGILAVGANSARQRLAASLQLEWATAVHPWAWIAPGAGLGHGTVVCAGAVVQPDTRVGAHAIVNTGATIDHDCDLGDYVHVAPGAHLAGGVRVGDGALVGIGASVLPGVEVGAWAVVGAGAVVVADLAAGSTAAGVPARLLGGG